MKKSVKWVALLSTLTLNLAISTNEGVVNTPNHVVSAQEISPSDQADYVLSTLADVYPNDTLPNYILTAQTPLYITAATTGRSDQDNFNVFYYAEDEPIQVDDLAVNELTPIAAFEKMTFESDAEAEAAVNQILDLQGQEVDLGYNITGYMQGAAGSSYLNWQEGNWSLIVQASNMGDNDPVDLAIDVVEYLEEVYLPAPENVGQITLKGDPSESLNDNTVVWQEGNVVYKVSHFDPLQAVRMTGSISEPE